MKNSHWVLHHFIYNVKNNIQVQLYNFIGILSLELLKWITLKNEKSRTRRECICFRMGIKKNGIMRWGFNWRLVKGMLISCEACQSLNSKHWRWTNWSGFKIWLSQATVSKKGAWCVCLCIWGWRNKWSCFFRVAEGNFSKADGKVSSWNFRNTYLHSFVQFSNNPDKLPGPDGWLIQTCCVPFCMQMKCLHVKRTLGRVQKKAANSA